MTCSFFIAVPSAWPGTGLLPPHGWEHRTQPGRGPGAFGGGGRFWLLLVVANQLQKREPMSSPAWHLHFLLSSPVIFTPTEEKTEKEEENCGGLRNTGVEITACQTSQTSLWASPLGQVPRLQTPEVARGGKLPWATTRGNSWKSRDYLTHRWLFSRHHPCRVSKLQVCSLCSTQSWAGLHRTWFSRRHLKQP